MYVTKDFLVWLKTMQRKFVFSFVCMLMGCMLSPYALASVEQGKTVYQQKCVACHTIGKGQLVGPDLKGVTTKRDRAWLVRWIVEPDKMLAEGDALATQMLADFNNVPMPNLGVTQAESEAILAYLAAVPVATTATPEVADNKAAETIVVSTTTVTPPVEKVVGDAVIGKQLFVGQQNLANGAPACIGCHKNSDIGGLGGGTLGPDLTKAYSRFGKDMGLPGVLRSLPFPTMQGVFAKQPLTEDEVAHIGAFLAQTDSLAEEPVNHLFVGIGLGLSFLGFILINILISLIWKDRLTGVRIPLVGR